MRGIDELRRELRRADKHLAREVGKAHRAIGSQIVVPAARERMQRTAKGFGGYLGAKGIKASSSATAARINLSGANPRTIGDEYGALAYRQFRPWRGNQFSGFDAGGGGYALAPVIREKREEIMDALLRSYYKSLSRAYPRG